MEKKLPNGLYAWSDADRKARRKKEEHEKKLATFGARVVEILRERGPVFMQAVIQADKSALSTLGRIYGEAIGLDLLVRPNPEEERPTPLDEERASFHRETLERRHDD